MMSEIEICLPTGMVSSPNVCFASSRSICLLFVSAEAYKLVRAPSSSRMFAWNFVAMYCAISSVMSRPLRRAFFLIIATRVS